VGWGESLRRHGGGPCFLARFTGFWPLLFLLGSVLSLDHPLRRSALVGGFVVLVSMPVWGSGPAASAGDNRSSSSRTSGSHSYRSPKETGKHSSRKPVTHERRYAAGALDWGSAEPGTSSSQAVIDMHLHTKSMPTARFWGVFDSKFYQGRVDLVDLVEKAWKKAERSGVWTRPSKSLDFYHVEMDEPVGYVEYRDTNGIFLGSSGPTSTITIQMEPGSNRIKDAMPGTWERDRYAAPNPSRGYPDLRANDKQWSHVRNHHAPGHAQYQVALTRETRQERSVFVSDNVEELVQEAWQEVKFRNIGPHKYLDYDQWTKRQETFSAYLVPMGRIIGHRQVREKNGKISEFPFDYVWIIIGPKGDLVTAYPSSSSISQKMKDNAVN
jgi:hypothetical protein